MNKPLEQRIYDGDQARLVLENEAFAAAFADIRKEYIDAWMKSPARDAEGRERIYLMLKMADKLEGLLKASLEDGQLAAIELGHQRGVLQRMRDAVSLV